RSTTCWPTCSPWWTMRSPLEAVPPKHAAHERRELEPRAPPGVNVVDAGARPVQGLGPGDALAERRAVAVARRARRGHHAGVDVAVRVGDRHALAPDGLLARRLRSLELAGEGIVVQLGQVGVRAGVGAD